MTVLPWVLVAILLAIYAWSRLRPCGPVIIDAPPPTTPDCEVEEVTLTRGAVEGAPVLLHWSCGCTERLRWVTGLIVEHDLHRHTTNFLDRTHRRGAP